MSRDQDAGRSHGIRVDNSSFEGEEEFIYSIQEESKSILKSGNVCYHSVQNLMSSSLLFKNVKIKIYRTVILPVVYRCKKNWSFTF